MGVFTEQVQGLVSEAQIKRRKQEEERQEKQYLQKLEKDLYYAFIDAFMENANAKKTYIFLTEYDTKCEILRGITRNTIEEKQDHFFYLLDLRYNKILNNAKQNFLPKYNEQEKMKKQQEKENKERIRQFYSRMLQQGPHL